MAVVPREENASYIASWLEVLKNDTRFIFKASAHAQRAADYLRAFSGTTTTNIANDDADARAA
jgi:antirestriction protein ArdC